MDKEILKSIIKEGQDEVISIELNERHFKFEDNGRYVLVGARHVGKSYLLYQKAKSLIANGHHPDELLFINFDDERLLGMKAEHFDLILQAYSSMYSYKPIIFFDEIQNISGWEHFARRLANQKYLIYITGSNAKMLSKDIATTLGARYIDEVIYPYSFNEFLSAKGILLDKNWEYGKKRDEIRFAFNEYFSWGGFPELLLFTNKRKWLNSLYEKILLGDIIQRNGIRNEDSIRLAIKRLAENIKQPTAYNRLANMIKSVGISTNTSSIIEYINFTKDSYIIFTLENYLSRFTERESIKKHYFIDNGLLNIFLTDSKTSLFENLCAIHLHKKYNEGLYFYNKNIEVDFYIPDEHYAIQASYSINDSNTLEREVSALIKLNALENLTKAQIITFDEEQIIERDDLRIEVLPIWKWLLEN